MHADVGGKPFSYRLDIDGFVDELITVEEQRKAIARLVKKHGFVVGKEIRQMRGNVPEAQARAFIREKYPQAVMLADLSESEALALYRSLG